MSVEDYFEKYEQHEADALKKQKEQYRLAFLAAAKDAGFTEQQILFIEKHFAEKGHEHWDGRIG